MTADKLKQIVLPTTLALLAMVAQIVHAEQGKNARWRLIGRSPAGRRGPRRAGGHKFRAVLYLS